MAVCSKPSWVLLGHLPCSTLHPDCGCLANWLQQAIRGTWGSGKYFGSMYLIQWLLKHRSLEGPVLIQLAINLFRSSLFGGMTGAIAVMAICTIRRLVGKFTHFSLGFLPGLLAGTGIFIEDKSRRGLIVTIFIAFIVDLYLKVLQDSAILKLTPLGQLAIFSIISSLLLYTLRVDHDSYTLLWPITPHKLPQDPKQRKLCAHQGSCWNDVRKAAVTYFNYGVAVQAVKLVATHYATLIKTPASFLKTVLRLNNLRLAIFSGMYVCLLKGSCCMLRWARGQDEAWHILLAGALASLCYPIQPNFTLALFAISNLSQILCRKVKKICELPSWPWEEMVFMMGIALMFHGRAFFPQAFPPYLLKVMDATTNNRSKYVYSLVEEHLLLRY